MILIKSIKKEYSTLDVIEWLDYFKTNYRVLEDNPYDSEHFFYNSSSQKESYVEFADKKLKLFDVDSFWYRRSYRIDNDSIDVPDDVNNKNDYKHFVVNEMNCFNEFFYEQIVCKNRNINTPNKGNVNRLLVFQKAIEVNLKVPNFIITNIKEEAEKFTIKFEKVVFKPLSNIVCLEKPTGTFLQYTKLVNRKFLKNLKSKIVPTLFQEYIEKEFEIRSFFIDGEFYSMAMFTQRDKQTNIDFRKYNYKNPARTIPFKLPKEIESKIRELFLNLEINSGSIDILYTREDEYYFLEINPVGQFGMVSFPCNYFLEKKIALKLIENEKQKKFSN